MLDGTKSLVEWPSEIMLTERPGHQSQHSPRPGDHLIIIISYLLTSQSFSAVLHATIIALTVEFFILDADSPVLTNFDKLLDALFH